MAEVVLSTEMRLSGVYSPPRATAGMIPYDPAQAARDMWRDIKPKVLVRKMWPDGTPEILQKLEEIAERAYAAGAASRRVNCLCGKDTADVKYAKCYACRQKDAEQYEAGAAAERARIIERLQMHAIGGCTGREEMVGCYACDTIDTLRDAG